MADASLKRKIAFAAIGSFLLYSIRWLFRIPLDPNNFDLVTHREAKKKTEFPSKYAVHLKRFTYVVPSIKKDFA